MPHSTSIGVVLATSFYAGVVYEVFLYLNCGKYRSLVVMVLNGHRFIRKGIESITVFQIICDGNTCGASWAVLLLWKLKAVKVEGFQHSIP